jgi:hypothetical protein
MELKLYGAHSFIVTHQLRDWKVDHQRAQDSHHPDAYGHLTFLLFEGESR